MNKTKQNNKTLTISSYKKSSVISAHNVLNNFKILWTQK